MEATHATGAEQLDPRDVAGRSVLLHVCCAPDATVPLQLLMPLAKKVVAYFHNPNVYPPEEYARRLGAMRTVASEYGCELVEGDYGEAPKYATLFSMYAAEPEGGERCHLCYAMRLESSARMAADLGLDCFATTLTISPHKNHRTINSLGEAAAGRWGVGYVASNFKKREGFKESVRLANELGLYRQNYCGCAWSRRD
jgi:predicted adenine nucleotide alpha hydrolase (AANH) superfamily ATPase